MAGLADEDLLNIGLAFQKYRLHKPDTDIPVPRYVIMGLQSAGKTRLLSMLARTKIGGAERSECGTRCPVEYTFEPAELADEHSETQGAAPSERPPVEPEFRFGTDLKKLSTGSAIDVEAFVSGHMKGLADEEERSKKAPRAASTSRGFSQEGIFVQVKAPKATPLVVTDCPGLQWQQKENNDIIAAIYKSQMEVPNTTAIIVSALNGTADKSQIDKELGQFVEGAGLPEKVYKSAVLLVNRLDGVKTNLVGSDELLRAFTKSAESRKLAEKRVGFMCLVPEVLGRHETPIQHQSMEEQNRYFAEDAWKLEREALDHFSEVHLGSKTPSFPLGVSACIDLIHHDLKRKILARWGQMRDKLLAEWSNNIEPRLDSVLFSKTEVDDRDLRADVNDYLAMNCEGLAGFQADDLARRLETCVGRDWVVAVNTAVRSYEASAGKTFLTECEEETELKGDAALSKVLRQKKTLRSLQRARDHPVAEAMQEHYFGEAAIRRLVMMQRYAWMKEDLRDFTLEEVRNMGGAINGENERGPDLRAIMRKAAEKQQASSAEDVTRFMSMVKRCLVSLCDHVRGVLKKSVPMLEQTPHLRSFIDEECVTRHYKQLMGKCCTDAEAKMQDLIKARFSSLRLDEPLNLVRILMCSGFDLGLLDPPSHTRDSKQQGGICSLVGGDTINTCLSLFMDKFTAVPEPLRERFQKLAETMVSSLLRSRENTETDEEFFKAIVSAARAFSGDPALTLALSDRLNVPSIPLEEYKSQLSNINNTIKSFVRFCRGMALMDVQMVLEQDVLIEARQLHNNMTLRMRDISDHLFADESQELLDYLKAPTDASPEEARGLLGVVKAYKSMLDQVRKTPDVPVQLQSICDGLSSSVKKLEKYVEDAERRAGMGSAGAQGVDQAELKLQFFERLAVIGERRSRRRGLEDTKGQFRKAKQDQISDLKEERERRRELEKKLAAAEEIIRWLKRPASSRSSSASSAGSAGARGRRRAPDREGELQGRIDQAVAKAEVEAGKRTEDAMLEVHKLTWELVEVKTERDDLRNKVTRLEDEHAQQQRELEELDAACNEKDEHADNLRQELDLKQRELDLKLAELEQLKHPKKWEQAEDLR